MSASILLYGLDRSLLRTRGMVLERAGFRVFHARSACELVNYVRHSDLLLVILCHTLEPERRDEALALIEQHCPWAKCLMLASGFSSIGAERCAVLSSRAGPSGLVEQVGRMVHAAQVSR
jgi:hypothetical protein